MTRMAASAVKDDERGIVGGGGGLEERKEVKPKTGNWEGAKGRSDVGVAPFWLPHAERASVPIIIIMMGLSWRIHTGELQQR
jgi:hypothetical protein